jgi:hypothetical protein
LLDVNLAGEMVSPVVDVLDARGVPFVLVSGYGATTLPASLRNRPTLPKPYETGDVVRVVSGAVGRPART